MSDDKTTAAAKDDNRRAMFAAMVEARETILNASYALLCVEETLKRCKAGDLSPSVIAHALQFVRSGLQRTAGDMEEVMEDFEY